MLSPTLLALILLSKSGFHRSHCYHHLGDSHKHKGCTKVSGDGVGEATGVWPWESIPLQRAAGEARRVLGLWRPLDPQCICLVIYSGHSGDRLCSHFCALEKKMSAKKPQNNTAPASWQTMSSLLWKEKWWEQRCGFSSPIFSLCIWLMSMLTESSVHINS